MIVLLPAAHASDDLFQTPLHWAAKNGLAEIASRLIENGARVEEADSFGRRALHFAVAYPAVVQVLLGAGAEVDVQDAFGRTPLHAALPYPQTVAILLGAGASISAVDFLGRTPLERSLSYGASSRNLQVINLLLDAGAGATRAD